MHAVPHPDMEEHADRFASALLMPTEDIGRHLTKVSLTKLAYLKRVWHVSMAALLMRAQSLGKLTSNQSRYLWVQMSKAGYRLREPEELDFPQEQPSVLSEILRLHLNELGYSIVELSSMLHVFEDECRDLYPGIFPTKVESHLRIVK